MKYRITKSRIVFNIFNYTALTLLTLAFLLPYVYIFSNSFTDERTLILNGYNLFPRKFSFDAYSYIFRANDLFINAIWVSVRFTLIGTLLTLVVCTLYAYPLSRSHLRGKKFFSLYMIFTMLFGGGLIPTYLVVSTFFDDMWAIIIPGAMAPYYTILLRNYFFTIPDSLEEAARIDGASHFRVLATIFVPLAKPVIATVVLFAAVSYWNNWVGPLIYVNDKYDYPVQYLIQQILDNVNNIYGGGSGILPTESIKFASVVIGSLPIILVYPFLQRYFINGLIIGGVKE